MIWTWIILAIMNVQLIPMQATSFTGVMLMPGSSIWPEQSCSDFDRGWRRADA